MHEKVAKRLFLIDGYGFVFRAFHSLPPLTNTVGEPVGAVYGFTNMLMKLRNRVRTANAEEAYIVCVFDAGKDTFRQEIYADYKANRPPAPDDLIPQFPMVRDAAAALNIESVEMVGFEADDIIATYATMAQQQGMHVTIVSSDKDLMQLVNDEVKMYDSLRDRIIGREQVIEKFGVPPEKVLDVLSLMGDSSDNIPGIKGIGPKTAAELINAYGSIDGVYENVEKITKKKLKENLVTFKDDAYLSRRLASLKYDVAVDTDISKYRIREDDPAKLRPFLEHNGFKSLLAKLGDAGANNNNNTNNSFAAAPRAAPTSHSTPPAPVAAAEVKVAKESNEEISDTVISGRAELAAWLPRLNECRKLAIHITDDAVYLASSARRKATLKAIEEETFHRTSEPKPQQDLFSYSAAQGESATVVNTFEPYFEVLKVYKESGSCQFILEDAKQFLKRGRQLPAAFDDVKLMNYVANGHVRGLKFEEGNIAGQLFAEHDELEKAIFAAKVNYIYNDVDKPLAAVLHRMEKAGILVDRELLGRLSKEFGEKLKGLEKEIYAIANEEFNIGSPKQLGEVLFEHMGIQGGRKTKSGAYTTDSGVLEELSAQGHNIADKVLEWRSFSKLVNTYTDALADCINPATGRIHTTFNQATTTTGRLSSTEPNLQNIPIRTEEGRRIRQAFIAAEDKKLIGADYSQIELRLLAHMANIPVLQDAFHNGLDIHAATAAQVFGVGLDRVDAELRRRAKTINFGIIYGQSAFGLAAQLGISRGEAKELIDKYFAQYPGIKRYMEDTVIVAREQGYVTTIWGRRIYLPGIQDKNAAVRNFNERAAINAPLQGTAADIIKRAMILIDKELHGGPAKMLLQIHDELIIECKETETESVMLNCKKIMENVISLSVPMVVDARAGKSWAEIH